VATEWKEALQNKEISMPFIVQREHFILALYFDHLSFFFNRNWKFPVRNTLGIMIKLADSNTGAISDKKIEKALTEQEAETFHDNRLPENLYVADATLFPESTGNPPILTIIAMAKRVSQLCS